MKWSDGGQQGYVLFLASSIKIAKTTEPTDEGKRILSQKQFKAVPTWADWCSGSDSSGSASSGSNSSRDISGSDSCRSSVIEIRNRYICLFPLTQYRLILSIRIQCRRHIIKFFFRSGRRDNMGCRRYFCRNCTAGCASYCVHAHQEESQECWKSQPAGLCLPPWVQLLPPVPRIS